MQEEARELVAELRREFELEVRDGLADDPVLARSAVEFEEAVQLVPLGDRTSPITIAFTNFPAVFVRWGRWQLSAYPGCGCDACDEDPADVSALLRADIDAVTAGRVAEEWDGHWLWTEVAHTDGSSSRGGSLREVDLESFGEPCRYEWHPWRATTPESG